MTDFENINLFSSSITVPEYVKNIDMQLRKFAYLVLIIVTILGIASMTFYYLLKIQNFAYNNTKTKLLNQLESLKSLENKYLVIKSRISLTESIVNSSDALGDLINSTYEISGPPFLKYINYDPSKQIITSFITPDLNSLAAISLKYEDLINSQKIQNALLNSFAVSEKGYTAEFTYKQK